MQLDIVLWPDPVLLGGTAPITEVDDELRRIVGEMRRVLFEQRGVGLAAPQVGVAAAPHARVPLGQAGRRVRRAQPRDRRGRGRRDRRRGLPLSFPGIYGDGAPRRPIARDATRTSTSSRARWRSRASWRASSSTSSTTSNGEVFIDRMTPRPRARRSAKDARGAARGASPTTRRPDSEGGGVERMRRYEDREALSPDAFRNPVATIGVFDGLHRGHCHVLEPSPHARPTASRASRSWSRSTPTRWR